MTQSKIRKPASRRSAAASSAYAVGFLGAGNMAGALIRGLISAGLCRSGEVCASDVEPDKLRGLKRGMGIETTMDNVGLVRASKVVVLAVKPQVLDAVLAEIGPAVTSKPLFVSIAAGVRAKRIEAALGGKPRVVRVMPNTPALLAKGMAAVVRGTHATGADERFALKLFRAVGKAVAVPDEALLDAVTGLSGSGPAYVYLFAEALIRGGIAAGLSAELAAELAFQTIVGAGAMLQETGETPRRLREMVTSPGGTTLAGLNELGRRGFSDAVAAAVVAATRRSIELGKG